MRPKFASTSWGVRWLLDSLIRPERLRFTVAPRPPLAGLDQVYFLRGVVESLFSRFGSARSGRGAGALTHCGGRPIVNVGKARGAGGGGPRSGSSGGIGGPHHGGGPAGSNAADGTALHESIVARIARRYGYRDTQAATLCRQSVQRVLALRQCVPLLGLAGVCLVDNPNLVTPDEELEGVCVEIRKIFDKINFDKFNEDVLPLSPDQPVNLSNFELGDPIAKGCNAVVYSAKFLQPSTKPPTSDATCEPAKKDLRFPTIREDCEEPLDAADPESPPLSSSPPRKYGPEIESPAGSVDVPAEAVQTGPLGSHDLALKMMFNYNAESNAAAIWQSLSRECAPLQTRRSASPARRAPEDSPHNQRDPRHAALGGALALATREAGLPPHPCIVDVKAAFVDRVPLLRGATQLYPDALPARLNERGIGRNATMFLVMKRYHCSLRTFVRSDTIEKYQRPERVRLSLCLQLFEAVAHLVAHGVAHRDMKSDNVLVELPPVGGECVEPRIALTDFGCCLIPADCITPMKLAFISSQVSRGGNMALMPPEVQSATPGLLSFIDYSKADLWSAATLVYEIYGQINPFYEGQLHACTYVDSDLPPLRDEVPPELRALVAACLHREPSRRPTAALAATVVQILLHAPQRILKPLSSRLQPYSAFNVSDVVQWLCDLSVDTLFAARREEDKGKLCSADHMLKRVFLARVKLRTVLEALEFIRDAREADEVDDSASSNRTTLSPQSSIPQDGSAPP